MHIQPKQRGIAIITTAVSLTLLIPILGLGVDAAMLWAARTKLNSACDAAALATARNLGVGANLPDQIAYATARGEAFFQANFDARTFRADPILPLIRIVETSDSNLEVTATARLAIPLYFMRYLGSQATEVQSSGRVNRRYVDLMLDLNTNVPKAMCTESLRLAKTFTNSFLGGRDRVGVSINGAPLYAVDSKFKEHNALSLKLDGVSCSGGPNLPVTLSLIYPDELHTIVSLSNVTNATKPALNIKIAEPAALSQAFYQLSNELLFSGR